MTDLILAVILSAIICGIIIYLCKQKRKGVKCVGCPYANSCAAKETACNCREDNE